MASTIFSGSSRFSTDFASVIDRSVAIASLPLTQMAQQRARMSDQGTALQALDGKVSALQKTLDSVTSSFGVQALAVSASDGSVLRPVVTDGASAGSYSIKVQDLGSATTYVVAGFPATSDPRSGAYTTAATQTLMIDADPSDSDPAPLSITLTPAGNTLQALVDEINAKASSSVRAVAVNIGSTSAPNYQISLQSTKMGSIDLTLTDGATTSANSVAQRGSAVKYTVNGADVVSDSRTVTLAPHVALDLLKQTSTEVSLNLTRSTTGFKSSLQSLISAYNDVVSEVDKHRGNKDAALAGDSVLGAVSDILRRMINTQSGSGSVKTLADLGVEFDKQGKLSLNSAAFDKATAGKFDEIKSFMGSTTTSGLLKSLDGILGSLENADHGTLKASIRINTETIALQDKHIADQQERIDRLRSDLQARIARADAMIAALEQQVTYFENMWSTMRSDSRNN